MPDATQQAIAEALRKNFKKAIEINRLILKENPDDIEALNRLGFALSEEGKIAQAKKVYRKVLSLNRFNPIAIKNVKRLDLLKGKKAKTGNSQQGALRNGSFAGLFLEEIGKTKVVTLINLAEAKLISNLHPTDGVLLIPRRRGVAVTTGNDVYIGALPDDIARRLYLLITGGNQYEAYIKSVDRHEVSIFIRETLRQRKFRNQPSFLGKGSSYYPFVREGVVSDEEKPDVSRLEDLDEEEEGKEGEGEPEEES